MKVLRSLADAGLEPHGSLFGYFVQQLFSKLRDDPAIDDVDLIKLELLYLPWLAGPSGESQELRLFDALEESPDLFAHLVRNVYRSEDETASPEADTEVDQQMQNAARNSQRVLLEWHGYPGRRLSETDQQHAVVKWASHALELTAQQGRKANGEDEVARVLARVPAGSDGLWPCDAARDLVESGNLRFRDALGTAKINLRGVVMKGAFEGGQQEWQLAQAFREDADKMRQCGEWPETAALLDKLKDCYEAEAQQADAAAKDDRLAAGFDEDDSRRDGGDKES